MLASRTCGSPSTPAAAWSAPWTASTSAWGPGEVLGLVGESGSGKSVTMRAILRLLRSNARATGGYVARQDLLARRSGACARSAAREIAVIFQEPMTALNPVLTIGAQIDESLVAHTALDEAARRRRARELLDLVGISSPERGWRATRTNSPAACVSAP